jgi:hypothetical protein
MRWMPFSQSTPGFSASVWTQQEVGSAVGRGVKIISFKMGEDPTGFISKHQALARGQRTAEQIAKEIDALLSADELTAGKLLAAKKTHGLVGDDIPFRVLSSAEKSAFAMACSIRLRCDRKEKVTNQIIICSSPVPQAVDFSMCPIMTAGTSNQRHI